MKPESVEMDLASHTRVWSFGRLLAIARLQILVVHFHLEIVHQVDSLASVRPFEMGLAAVVDRLGPPRLLADRPAGRGSLARRSPGKTYWRYNLKDQIARPLRECLTHVFKRRSRAG